MGHSTLDCDSYIVVSREVLTASVSTGPNYQFADYWCIKHLCTTTAEDTSIGHFRSHCLDYGIYLRGKANVWNGFMDQERIGYEATDDRISRGVINNPFHSDYQSNSRSATVSSVQFITHLYPFLLLLS